MQNQEAIQILYNLHRILPANPIYQKIVKQQSCLKLKMETVKEIKPTRCIQPKFKKVYSQEDASEEQSEQSDKNIELYTHVKSRKCIYIKIKNESKSNQYASQLIDKTKFDMNNHPLRDFNSLYKLAFEKEIEISQSKSKQIKFNSNFQSGNLYQVMKKNVCEYDLVVQNDINTKGNTQWFYFSVQNLPKDIPVKFNIINMVKSDSLFNYGMQPVVFSQQRTKNTGQTWYRTGTQISYFKNSIRRQNSRRYYYTLTFKISTSYSADKLLIAHCYPYTYSMLKQYLYGKIKDHGSQIHRQIIGKSIAKNDIQCLTITEQSIEPKVKQIIIILCRQHPGQSQSSFICQGLIDYLLNKSEQSDRLKKKFIFKIFPMVNPDGVIFGNYRTNLLGFDLNRKWMTNRMTQNVCQIKLINKYIQQLNKGSKIRCVLDLHGHSKKFNSFFYGNSNPDALNLKLYPYICSKICPQISYYDCNFHTSIDKRNTARVYLAMNFSVINTYTFQTSFYGYIKDNQKSSFGINQYKELGESLMSGIYYCFDEEQQKNTIYKQCYNQLKSSPMFINVGNDVSSGSQSNPEEFQFGEDFNMHKNCQSLLNIKQKVDIKNTIALSSAKLIAKAKTNRKQQKKNSEFVKLTKVNGVIPSKYQLGFCPIKKLSPQNLNLNLNKHFSLQTEKKQKTIQTDTVEQNMWLKASKVKVSYQQLNQQIQDPIHSVSNSSRFKNKMQYSFVHYKKLKQLKLDIVSTSDIQFSKRSILKNNFSQTLLSFKQNMEPRPKMKFPSVEIARELSQQMTTRAKQIHKTRNIKQKEKNNQQSYKRSNEELQKQSFTTFEVQYNYKLPLHIKSKQLINKKIIFNKRIL